MAAARVVVEPCSAVFESIFAESQYFRYYRDDSIHTPTSQVAEVVFESAAVHECILRLIHSVPSGTFSTDRVRRPKN